MHIVSSLGGPGLRPAKRDGHLLAASIDVEWSKNYRIKNGNRAFCYSIVWLSAPEGPKRGALMRSDADFHYTSAYVDRDDELADLISLAASDIGAAVEHADIITGHQLCSDLAVLTRNAARRVPGSLVRARQSWAQRRDEPESRFLDTRYDAGHLLEGTSRRLVDVCCELALRVTQPELSRKSMTALHREWLTQGNPEARERISVLNLRHSLSTALVALRAAGRSRWTGSLNVNSMLWRQLAGVFEWLEQPTFQSLLEEN